MPDPPPDWVRQAATLPLAFAQVREDPLLDLWVVRQLSVGARIIMVASGGCTAGFLATSPSVAELHLVDPNPAQLALSRLKLRMLQTVETTSRLALLGHSPLSATERKNQLAELLTSLGLPVDALGPPEWVAEVGPDHAGRYEFAFAQLRLALSDCARELAEMLQLADPPKQQRRVAATTVLGERLDESLDQVLALSNLVRLFGEEATRNPVESFGRHFAGRMRHVLATLPANRNPYLWQMLVGRYHEQCTIPWLSAPVLSRMPEIVWTCGFMADALCRQPGTFDFVHLSNILDWLSPEKARATLESAWGALRPGGLTLIRQLNSTLDIPSLGPMFEWLKPEAEALHARDRSFFYRALHLGRKR